jgi:DNA-binding HxlR family transcriptional regulator
VQLAAGRAAVMLLGMRRGYGQYCTIALGAEVLAERWTPLIIRNLSLNCHRFSEIHQGCPRLSTTLLSTRLRTLERDGVITSVESANGRGRRYYLTPAGEELAEVVAQLGVWGARFREVVPREQDPYIALWSWARMIDIDELPAHRVVVRFDLRDRPRERYWLLLQRPRPEVCVSHPGGEDDVVVHTDVATLVDVQRSRVRMSDAIARRLLVLDGDPILARELPTWGGISPPLGQPVGLDCRPTSPAD